MVENVFVSPHLEASNRGMQKIGTVAKHSILRVKICLVSEWQVFLHASHEEQRLELELFCSVASTSFQFYIIDQ
jgi:hypothetical protein